jgi:predicted outer membrane protein
MTHVNPIQVQKFLKGVDYPASKAALIEKAHSMGADENICASLEQLPNEDFQTPAEVSQAFGQLPDEVSKAGAAGTRPSPRGKAEARTKGKAGQRYTGTNEFLVQAMQDAMAEIQICEIALEKLDNAEARAFAQSMIDEHGRMGRALEKLAESKKLDMQHNIRPEQEMTVEELSSLQGRDFGQRWIQYNIDVHERDIKVFQHYCSEEYDADIRELARMSADTFGKHLKIAHDVGRKLAGA